MKYKILAVATGLLLAASLTSLPPAYAAASYGPVKNNETLWDIASRRRPSYDISVPQMMAAIRAQNPQAFIDGDINLLKRGTYLKIPVMPEVKQSAGKQASLASLRAEIRRLRGQLKTEQQHSATLAKQLKALQATQAATPSTTPLPEQAQVAQLQNDLMIKLQTELTELKQQVQVKDARIKELEAASVQVATLPNATNDPTTSVTPAQAQQDDAAMQAELTELKQLLEQRDTHIQNLQASLREASISIKRQYAESQELYGRLKELEPGNTVTAPQPPAEPGSTTPPNLTLAANPEADQTPTAPPEQAPVFTDQLTPPTATTETGKAEKPGTSLQNILEQQVSGSEDGKLPAPARVSLVVALISLMFILALLWRSLSQRRALNREEERLRAELEG
ncbi:MAG: FimV/HubP family polar landmark protein [Candidatus Thiothrix putei]|uniref:FimV/HubP family polar landmark protein n=1 Tax=Candidatus Thiothrix putei TaxID=3080811 RepID=A0AA95HGE8_9GAMM|nr:MAG: FimV/HubP family polar landmark protein [Candidatus Thiothrix putei]